MECFQQTIEKTHLDIFPDDELLILYIGNTSDQLVEGWSLNVKKFNYHQKENERKKKDAGDWFHACQTLLMRQWEESWGISP